MDVHIFKPIPFWIIYLLNRHWYPNGIQSDGRLFPGHLRLVAAVAIFRSNSCFQSVHFHSMRSRPRAAAFYVIQIMSRDCLWKPESIRIFAGEGKLSIEIIGTSQGKTTHIPNWWVAVNDSSSRRCIPTQWTVWKRYWGRHHQGSSNCGCAFDFTGAGK